MFLFQDVSINDVNEVVKKIGNIFKHVIESVVPETVDSSVQYYIVITIDYPPIIFVGFL
jgi:hypothetical protein